VPVIEEGLFKAADHRAIETLSSSWRSTKTVKQEARFLVRPLAFGEEPDVRKICLRASDGHLVAFVVFDPIYEDGQVVGYSPAIKRRASDAPTGAEEAITKFAIERFRDEGMTTFRLGLLPLHNVEKSAFRAAGCSERFSNGFTATAIVGSTASAAMRTSNIATEAGCERSISEPTHRGATR
jgi:lysylphosphatidylglycerol synthetase-like protein (DUF2156 family)